MSKGPSAEEFSSLKQQYEQLLDKNQDDLIKIKQREKNLDQQLQIMKAEIELLKTQLRNTQQQAQEQERTLQLQIHQLQTNNQPPDLLAQEGTNPRLQQLEIDVRRLMDQNVSLTAQINSLTMQHREDELTNQKLVLEVERLTNCNLSLEKEMRVLKGAGAKETQDSSSMTCEQFVGQAEFESYQQEHEEKQGKLKQENREAASLLEAAQEEVKHLQSAQKKYLKLLKKKENELASMEGEVSKLRVQTKRKKTDSLVEGDCPKCSSLKQEIQLLKQMVKSTQGMVRVKEIENAKFKMQSSQDTALNPSKSVSKHYDKGTPLPPLKKK